MDPDPPFADLLRRARAGDQAAADALCRGYEAAIRREARFSLRAFPRLRRLVDTVDISQSVFARFFVKDKETPYELHDPRGLLRLLVTMVHNRVLDHARRLRRAVLEANTFLLRGIADPCAGPTQVVADAEALEELFRLLSPDERWLAEQWAAGRPWAEIAAERGKTPDALRQQLRRALDRVGDEMGLQELGDE